MIAGLALAGLGAVSLLLSLNVWRPLRAPATVATFSFFAGWLVGELAIHHVLAQLAGALALVVLGGATGVPAAVGGALLGVSWLLLIAFYAHGHLQRTRIRAALDAAGAPEDPAHARGALETLRKLVVPIPVFDLGVRCTGHVPFARIDGVTLKLDVHQPRAGGTGLPVLVYVHGGGWVIGHREHQGLPLLQHFAARGWVCFSVDHRRSPRATFPEHLCDVKSALAWVREHAHEYGGDPSFLVLAGNSSGAHLAALAALTGNDPVYQPGFEHADTSVQACLGFYGVYDLFDRHGHHKNDGLRTLLERWVLKCSPADAPERYREHSPIDRVHAGRPPFLLVHGTRDTLSPVGEARRFAEALRAVPGATTCYLEVPYAQHAFEVFPSPRALHVLDGAFRFASAVRARHAVPAGFGREPPRPQPSPSASEM